MLFASEKGLMPDKYDKDDDVGGKDDEGGDQEEEVLVEKTGSKESQLEKVSSFLS